MMNLLCRVVVLSRHQPYQADDSIGKLHPRHLIGRLSLALFRTGIPSWNQQAQSARFVQGTIALKRNRGMIATESRLRSDSFAHLEGGQGPDQAASRSIATSRIKIWSSDLALLLSKK